jgi:hypothetical protein
MFGGIIDCPLLLAAAQGMPATLPRSSQYIELTSAEFPATIFHDTFNSEEAGAT